MTDLNLDSITFGKYKGQLLSNVLKDRSYCYWVLKQDWFQNNYEYLYNRIEEFKPLEYFFKKYEGDSNIFLNTFEYFNLVSPEEIKLNLVEDELKCYRFYLNTIEDLKNKILNRIGKENQYDIKAPTKWLQKFEVDTGLKREIFKNFLSSYELQNITSIIETIKNEGGIEYKGAKSFNIAKERSSIQEIWWEVLLKKKYGEDLGTQYKYENCIFDFLNISTNTIFECKLGLKDFNDEQHKKYILTLNGYRLIYLIGQDAVIHMNKKIIYTHDTLKYILYKSNIQNIKKPTYLDNLLTEFDIIFVEDLSSLFGISGITN